MKSEESEHQDRKKYEQVLAERLRKLVQDNAKFLTLNDILNRIIVLFMGAQWAGIAQRKMEAEHARNIELRRDYFPSNINLLDAYRGYSLIALVAFTTMTARARLLVVDQSVLVAIIGIAMGLVGWLIVDPPTIAIAFFSKAHATSQHVDLKPYVSSVSFLALLALFIFCVYVTFYSKSERKVKLAESMSKTLLGFFIGAAVKYL